MNSRAKTVRRTTDNRIRFGADAVTVHAILTILDRSDNKTKQLRFSVKSKYFKNRIHHSDYFVRDFYEKSKNKIERKVASYIQKENKSGSDFKIVCLELFDNFHFPFLCNENPDKYEKQYLPMQLVFS